MKPLLINCALILFIVLTSCSTLRSGDYKIYCVKGDQSSLRIIPKSDPFTPISDSIKFHLNLSISNLKAFEPKIENDYKKVYNEKIKELDNQTYINLSLLRSYYLAYRTQPCDPKAYTDYITNLNKLTDKLLNVKTLNEDIEKTTKGGAISGTTNSLLIDLVTKYINSDK